MPAHHPRSGASCGRSVAIMHLLAIRPAVEKSEPFPDSLGAMQDEPSGVVLIV